MSAESMRELLRSRDFAGLDRALSELRLERTVARLTGRSIDLSDKEDQVRLVASRLRSAVKSAQAHRLAPAAWVGGEATGLDAAAYRARAADLIGLAATALGSGALLPGSESDFISDTFRIAFSVSPESVILGDKFGGFPLHFPSINRPRPRLEDVEKLLKRTCVGGVMKAMRNLGSVARLRPSAPAGATVTSIKRRDACPGDKVKILGSGFGRSQPANVKVIFPRYGGGWIPAGDVRSWTDTAITVVVPVGVGRGSAGLTEFHAGFEQLFSVAAVFAGELEGCLGMGASPAAQQILKWASLQISDVRPLTSVQFDGGPPWISLFSANGRRAAAILPNGAVELVWQIHGADEAEIHLVQGPGQYGNRVDPQSGTVTIDPSGIQDGQTALWSLTARNRCGRSSLVVSAAAHSTRALVLSGGGTKGAFEVGAVRCLMDGGINFQIISGTSAGAINAAKLAEGGNSLSELEAFWSSIIVPEDFYTRKPWLIQLQKNHLLSEFFESIASNGAGSGSLWSGLGRQAVLMAASAAKDQILGSLANLAGIPSPLYSITTGLIPLIQLGIDVTVLVNALDKAKDDNSILIFSPIDALIAQAIDPAKVVASGIKLRISALSLETGTTVVFDEHGYGETPRGPVQDTLTRVVIGSATVPVAFCPIRLGTLSNWQTFVDGGVRDNVSVAPAIEAGADQIYCVLLNPQKLPEETVPVPLGIKYIAARSFEAAMNELQREDLNVGDSVPMEVIAPTFAVYDTLDVDPGLIDIMRDYGYMRTFDVVLSRSQDESEMIKSSDEITALRVQIWALEHHCNQQFPTADLTKSQLKAVADPAMWDTLRTMKVQLRSLAEVREQRNDGNPNAVRSVPGYLVHWWQDWERHWFTPLETTPWAATSFTTGEVYAATMPAPYR